MDQGSGSGIRAIHHVTKRIGREVATSEERVRCDWLVDGQKTDWEAGRSTRLFSLCKEPAPSCYRGRSQHDRTTGPYLFLPLSQIVLQKTDLPFYSPCPMLLLAYSWCLQCQLWRDVWFISGLPFC